MKLILILCSFPLFVFAESTRSSVSLSTGGAGVAAIDPGEATFINPAGIMHLRGRYFFSTVQKDSFAISLIENDPASAVPGAIGYEHWKNWEAFGLSLADRAWGRMAMGLNFKYFQLKPADREEKRTQMLNGNLGLTWAFSRQFAIGAAFENISEIDDKFKIATDLEPRTRLGLNYIYKEWFRLRFDGVTLKNNNFKYWVPQVGFETSFGQWMVGRMGWFREPGYQESWTAGFGLSLPRFKLDYAYQDVNSEQTEIRHSIDLGVPF
jgi:hypothetical protein